MSRRAGRGWILVMFFLHHVTLDLSQHHRQFSKCWTILWPSKMTFTESGGDGGYDFKCDNDVLEYLCNLYPVCN